MDGSYDWGDLGVDRQMEIIGYHLSVLLCWSFKEPVFIKDCTNRFPILESNGFLYSIFVD